MDTSVACPLDSRRGVTEVFIKRIAVMVTVLCLLGHLNSLRGIKSAKRLPMCIWPFLFNPLYPLLTLIFDIGWVTRKARTDSEEREQPHIPLSGYTKAWTAVAAETGPPDYYIAAAIGMHTSYGGKGRDGMSTSLLRLPPSVTQMEKEYDTPQGIKRIGRLIVLTAAAVQCSATILLGIRMELHGGATPSDRRYYLYAASGMAILAQTLVAQLLSRKYFRTNTGDIEEHGVSVVIEVLHYVVSLCLVSYYASDVLINYTLFVAAIFTLCPFLWPYDIFFGYFREISWREWRDDLLRTILEIVITIGMGLVVPGIAVAASTRLFVLASYNPFSDHFTSYSGTPAPTDVPCPFLWQDPLANTLWAF
jgi:hypothetical protein